MSTPLISIVIANFNYGRFIESSIKSIVEQEGFDKCELIVVDGGSTDDSVEIIRKYADKIAWWCSEKDKGQSDAFNKGFAHARGRLGCWVNADDILLHGALRAVITELSKNNSVEWIAGGTIFVDPELNVVKARIGSPVPRPLQNWLCGEGCAMVGGPSSFFSIERLRAVGGFDVSLRFTMDGDLWYRFLRNGMRIKHISRYLWGFRVHEESKTSHALSCAKSPAFSMEDERFRRQVGWSSLKVKIMRRILSLIKILSGSILYSIVYTNKTKGRKCPL